MLTLEITKGQRAHALMIARGANVKGIESAIAQLALIDALKEGWEYKKGVEEEDFEAGVMLDLAPDHARLLKEKLREKIKGGVPGQLLEVYMPLLDALEEALKGEAVKKQKKKNSKPVNDTEEASAGDADSVSQA